MISDVLSEAVIDINGYLDDPTFDAVYKGKVRERIINLRTHMEEMRAELDTLPQKKK